MFGYCQLKIKYAAQIMSVSELFIKMSVNKESREDFCAIVHIYAGILFYILEKRIGFTKQIQVKENLFKKNMKINWYFKPSMPLRQCML